ncbi:hypothetical protein [Thermus caldilimi]|nr:hypothetical protein [Thermus caldilimi]
MKGMQATLPPKVLEAARRVEALLEEAQARGVVRRWSLRSLSGEPLPGVEGIAFYGREVSPEEIDHLQEAFLDLEDELDLGVAVILVPHD